LDTPLNTPNHHLAGLEGLSMHRRRTIDLDFGDFTAPVIVSEETSETSPHTGKELRVVRGEINARGEDVHEVFSRALEEQGPDGISSHETPIDPRQQWIVKRGNYSIRGDQYQYQVTLREVETFEIESLVINGFDLQPTRYKEEPSKEIMHIKAVVIVPDDTRDELRRLIREGDYFPVIRRGINDNPIEMRFGMCGWSEHPEGTKYSLILVDRRYDEVSDDDRKLHITSVQAEQRHSALAYRIELVEELIGLLIGKGVLGVEEVEEAREKARERIWEREHKWLQVIDVDELAW
jgi:hypothetical protein